MRGKRGALTDSVRVVLCKSFLKRYLNEQLAQSHRVGAEEEPRLGLLLTRLDTVLDLGQFGFRTLWGRATHHRDEACQRHCHCHTWRPHFRWVFVFSYHIKYKPVAMGSSGKSCSSALGGKKKWSNSYISPISRWTGPPRTAHCSIQFQVDRATLVNSTVCIKLFDERGCEAMWPRTTFSKVDNG